MAMAYIRSNRQYSAHRGAGGPGLFNIYGLLSDFYKKKLYKIWKASDDAFMNNVDVVEAPEIAVFFESENPKAMINLVPKAVAAEVRKLDPTLLMLPEHRLKKRLDPDLTTDRLRYTFWQEHQRALALNRNMRMNLVYDGVCSRALWDLHIIKDPQRLAWIVTPPTDYMIGMGLALQSAMEQIADVVTRAKLIDEETGKLDAAGLSSFLKTLEFLHAVVKGPLVQRIESKSMNINVDAKDSVRDVSKLKPEEIEARIAQLTSQINKSQVIDVESARPTTD